VDQAQQDVLGPDVVVVEQPGLFLGQDDYTPRVVGEPLEHIPSQMRALVTAASPALSPLGAPNTTDPWAAPMAASPMGGSAVPSCADLAAAQKAARAVAWIKPQNTGPVTDD
jgi:hypothetical protein